MILRQAAVLLVIAWVLDACDGVPTLTFLADDDATSPGDGGATAESGCPDQPPPGAICCQNMACAGDCDAHCADCLAKACTPPNICCARAGGVSCHDPSFICN